jgi:hypothetical protein
MTEPQISPLARRLAEENSIDWRVIPGTGPENRVIERDILTYLARIMSGEIDPPALPDASEPASIGSAAPDLSEVSNLAAASAGMAKEGIDLSSLLSGTAPAAVPPIFTPPAPREPVIPEPAHTNPLSLQAFDAPPSAPLDFTFSNEPMVASPHTSLEQISFGDSLPAAVETPISFGYPATTGLTDGGSIDSVTAEPAFSAPPAKVSPADSMDAEFEIDLDDFDDAPAALEVSFPEVSLPQSNAAEISAFELTSPELAFTAAPSDLGTHQEDLVLDIDSTSEAPLTIAALDASGEMDDDFVMADLSGDFTAPAVNSSPEVFNLEPAASESLSFELTELEPVHLEPVHLQPINPVASIAPIEHDDFELDLIDADSLPIELTDPATPTAQPVQPLNPVAPLKPELIPGGTVAAAAVVGEMLVSATHHESVTAPDSPAQAAVPEATPPESSSQLVQPLAALDIPDAQPSAAVLSSSVASSFFQGFAVRRHFDASALTKIQHELTQSLNGREVPLAVFLARAAQRNLHTLNIGDVVTLTRLGDTLEPLHASGLHHSFIEAVQSVARATPGAMQGLLILDASSLGVDDLVLPVDLPVLTLNVKGEYGHLALAGDLAMGKAAEFLAHVVQALEIPVGLVI